MGGQDCNTQSAVSEKKKKNHHVNQFSERCVHQHSGCSEAQCSDDQDGQDLQGDISKTLFQ